MNILLFYLLLILYLSPRPGRDLLSVATNIGLGLGAIAVMSTTVFLLFAAPALEREMPPLQCPEGDADPEGLAPLAFACNVLHRIEEAKGQAMKIIRSGTTPSARGPAEWFTGTVRLDPLIQAEPPGRVAAVHVTFEPGARTAWHTHPAGQTLLVTFGRGRVQREGGPVEEIGPGDVVWFPAGEKHWHGAAPEAAMSHVAIQESVDGSAVTWMEPVSEADYRGDASDG